MIGDILQKLFAILKSIVTIQPAERAIAVTPSNTININFGGTATQSRAIYIGVAGNMSVEMAEDDIEKTVVFVGIVAGTVLPISITRVNSTSTTATNIVAIW